VSKGQYKIFDIFNLLLKPEKCPVCGEYMKVFKKYNDNHEVLERDCDCIKQTEEDKKAFKEYL
jgi:hypothetical protein